MFIKKLSIAASAALAVVFAVVLVVVFALVLTAAEQAPLVEGFKNPPDIARPRVYWYWMNGNITKEGITKDIEWFYRAGIRGMETFDVGGFAGRGGDAVVKPPLLYMQPDWKDAFHHALQERLGELDRGDLARFQLRAQFRHGGKENVAAQFAHGSKP